MPDLIRFGQRVIGKLTGRRELFQFTPARFDNGGLIRNPLRERQSRLARIFGQRWFSRRYPGIVGRVHIHDSMLENDWVESIEHYASVGHSAMHNIEASLAEAGHSFSDIGACLDMACGYGRVLRLLQTRVDPKKIVACDIEEEAVRFVASEFGVEPVVSTKNLGELNFSRTFDLIWVGSLFTHLPPEIGFGLLDKLSGQLNPGGVLLFSTQGEPCLERITFYGWMFVPQEQMFREKMASEGMAYGHYFEHDHDYGIALYRRDVLEAEMAKRFGERLRLVRFAEQGWDNHQDVWAFQRVAAR